MAIMSIENYSLTNMPVIGETLKLHVYAKTVSGLKYNLSGYSKIYCTAKTDPSVADGSASWKIDTTTNPTLFNTANINAGELIVTIPAATTDDLTAGQTYYIDIKAIYTSETIYILRAADIRFVEWVTQATS